MSDTPEPIEAMTTVHLGSGPNRIRPGDVVVVDPDDPTVALYLAGGLMVAVRGSA